MDFDILVLSLNTGNINEDLRNLENKFVFRKLDEDHDLFSNKNKKVIGKLEN